MIIKADLPRPRHNGRGAVAPSAPARDEEMDVRQISITLGIYWALAATSAGAEDKAGFRTLDLRGIVNMGWRDEVPGDGKGGWTDQGANDMRKVRPGRREFCGIPFDLIDAATNDGKAVLTLKSRNFAAGPASRTAPVGARAVCLYFLHAAAWNRGHMATYVVHYADGTAAEVPIRANQEIENWWTPKHGKTYRAAFHVSNAECDDVGMLVYAWTNPKPAKVIKALELRSENGAGVPIIAAVTLSAKKVGLTDPKPAAKGQKPRGAEGEYLALLEAGKAGEAVRRVLASVTGGRAGAEIDALGKLLSINAPLAGPVLDALAACGSAQAATVHAELLLWAARGDETPSWQRKNRTVRPQEMPTEELGRRAGALLDHADPFVRGLAEWAIAVRLGQQCEGPRSKPWPGPAKCEWFAKFLSLGPETYVELDYVRQAAGLGLHRSTAGLLKSAEDVFQRTAAAAEDGLKRLDAKRAAAVTTALARLQQARRKLEDAAAASPGDLTDHRKLWLVMRRAARDVVLAGPDAPHDKLLFATRTGNDGGNITNGHLRDIYGPGGDLHVKTGLSPTDPAEPLIQGRLGRGHIRGLDLAWGADRVIFSFLKQPTFANDRNAASENTEKGLSEPAHLYEMRIDPATGRAADGTIRQLTDAPYNSDFEPCYLPDGDIVFTSDRSNYGSQCAGGLVQDKMIVNLWRTGPDGRGIHALSNNKDSDRYPHMMENGQLLFLHWEYQERHLWQTHTLWACRPDGTMTDAIYKQHIASGPMSLREARQVPGQEELVAIACGHHNCALGAVMLVDYAKGINEEAAMRLVTPRCSKTEGGYGRARPVPEGGVPDAGGHYQYPWPLSDKAFLVAYSYKKRDSASGRNFGLYYIDVWGNKELIHRDRRLSVTYLLPLAARKRPPLTLASRGEARGHALAYIQDVHAGMPGVKPGTVKYIRISQHAPWPCVRDASKSCKFNDLHYAAAGAWTPVFGAWTWSPARVIGIVPVEADGSAYFRVPSDQPVYFQALDESFVEIRRMRSNVTFRDAEHRGCVGCHETTEGTLARPGLAVPAALGKAPSVPEPPAWGDRIVPGYDRHVQPVLDKHCIRCHGQSKPAAGREFTSRIVDHYPQGYRTMFGLKPTDPTPVASQDGWRWIYKKTRPGFDKEALKRMARNEHPGQLVSISDRFSGPEVTKPQEFGSSRSKLIRTLLNPPAAMKSVKLSREDWISLVTWVDLNAPYFDTYTDKDTVRRTGLARYVRVEFPDPWQRPPAGEWIWKDLDTVVLKP